MPRGLSLLMALVASLAIAACSSTPLAPPLTDPKEILTKSVEATLKAKSVHFQAVMSGTISADMTGAGQPSEFKLDGTTAEGDLDIAGKKVRASFSAPAFLGLTGEAIQIGSTSYFKTSLTGAKYQKQVTDDVSVDEATDPAKAMEELRKVLEMPGMSPTKVADSKCGDNKDCYNVEFDLTGDELAAMASEAPDPSLAGAAFKLTIGVERESLRMSKMTLAVTLPEMGSVDLTVNMTKWDEPVTITEPAADQIAP